jgi:hypothetical protein
VARKHWSENVSTLTVVRKPINLSDEIQNLKIKATVLERLVDAGDQERSLLVVEALIARLFLCQEVLR